MMSSPNAACDATTLHVAPPSAVAATEAEPSMMLSATSQPWSASTNSTPRGITNSVRGKGSVTRDHVAPPSVVRNATEVSVFLVRRAPTSHARSAEPAVMANGYTPAGTVTGAHVAPASAVRTSVGTKSLRAILKP